VPHEHAAGREHARELGDHSAVVARLEEEAERREQVRHGVEPARSTGRQRRMSAPRVAERASVPRARAACSSRSSSPSPSDVDTRLGEQVRVGAPCPHGQSSRARRRQREQAT
jgi:hypothetical protein